MFLAYCMKSLVEAVEMLRRSPVEKKIAKRMKQFSAVRKKSSEHWFSEMCFCILAANARSSTSWNIQKELGHEGFMGLAQEDLAKAILRNKHRFHNNKASFIITGRKHKHIKDMIQPALEKKEFGKVREWLVEQVKGFGMKESSHFLRNIGYPYLAILDRHVINHMVEHGLVKEQPKSLTKAHYMAYEGKLQKVADKLGMQQGEMDM
jgi:N-glycosylase/DNA lyase